GRASFGIPATNPVPISSQGFPAFCPGNSVKLIASQWLPNLQWFRNGLPVAGATSDTLRATDAGQYNLRLLGNNGCYSNLSPTIGVSVLAQPAKPRVTAVGAGDICNGSNTVRLTAAGLYNAEWHRTGSNFSAWVDTLATTQEGAYYVQIHATNGCNANSDTFVVRSLVAPPTYSISANGNVLSVQSGYEFYQWYRDGVVIIGANASQYTAGEAGIYRVDVGNSATCKTSSATLTFTSTAVSTLELGGALVAFYPNPVQNELRVNLQGARLRNPLLRIIDASGRCIRTTALKPGVNTLSLSGLPAGIYHAVLQDDRGSNAVRLVKVP
ncbi:MAG: T9SS type A sorting domain-containing protein, partial [Sphingobacteriales bacterium]